MRRRRLRHGWGVLTAPEASKTSVVLTTGRKCEHRPSDPEDAGMETNIW
jgi:hypothetical protein